MTTQELMLQNSDKKVSVTYPDNKGNHETTVRDISDRFINEGADWRKQFFHTLLTTGEAFTRMGGHYKLLS